MSRRVETLRALVPVPAAQDVADQAQRVVGIEPQAGPFPVLEMGRRTMAGLAHSAGAELIIGSTRILDSDVPRESIPEHLRGPENSRIALVEAKAMVPDGWDPTFAAAK